jgi:hypothetical protein
MGSTHNGASTPRWAVIEDSAEEFLIASSGRGASAPPLPEGVAWGFPSPVATTPRLKDILDIVAAQQVESSLQC